MALAYSSGSHSSHIIHVGLWISASPDRSTQEQISNPDPSCMSMVTLDTLQSLLTQGTSRLCLGHTGQLDSYHSLCPRMDRARRVHLDICTASDTES